MGIGELLLLAVGLSMDAFAVSICKGLCTKHATMKEGAICGIWFGGFQALMPLLGFLLASTFADAIQSVSHWVAFGLLALIGISMLKEAFEKKEEACDVNSADFSAKVMFIMAVATSIDAAAVGVSLAVEGDTNIWIAISLIGVTTCILSAIGVKIGNLFGNRYEKKAQFAGGAILILLGIKILLEGLKVL